MTVALGATACDLDERRSAGAYTASGRTDFAGDHE